jgi:hypothetical protein
MRPRWQYTGEGLAALDLAAHPRPEGPFPGTLSFRPAQTFRE